MSEKEEKNRKVKLQRFVDDLRSLDKKKFKEAIEGFKMYGDSSVIAVLAEIYNKCSEEQKIQIVAFISDIRDEESPEVLMDAILNSKDEELRVALLSTIWNSTNDYNDYLNEFVRIAINGSFMEALECHTIIDNLPGPFDEATVMDAKIIIKENIRTLMDNEQKSHLLSDILLKIEEFDQQIES